MKIYQTPIVMWWCCSHEDVLTASPASKYQDDFFDISKFENEMEGGN